MAMLLTKATEVTPLVEFILLPVNKEKIVSCVK